MTRAAEKMEWIKTQAAAGRTVYVHSVTRITKLTPKIIAAGWALKVAGDDLWLAHGKRWVCINFNALSAQ